MKLKTVRVHRSRPSALSAALALMATMLMIYLISLSSAAPETQTEPAAGLAPSTAQLRMEGLEVCLELDGRYPSALEARVAAARCALSDGAGLILPDGDQYAVIRGASAAAGSENTLLRSAPGLTLKISGPAAQIQTLSDAVAFLYSQATETAGLVQGLEGGIADAGTMETLFSIYRTSGEKIRAALLEIPEQNVVVDGLARAVQSSLAHLHAAATPSNLRLLHASACAEWISLLEEFAAYQ